MKIKVDLYLILSIIILFLFKQLDGFLSFYILVFFHEIAHIIMAKILNIRLIDISFLPLGVNAKFDFKNSKLKEIIIAIAGPLFSLSLFILDEKYRIQNLFIFITNMLPIYPLDGGRILKNIIVMICGNKMGIKIYNMLIKVFIIVLIIISLVLIVFLKNYQFIFFSMYIFQIASEEIKKDKVKVQVSSMLNIEN